MIHHIFFFRVECAIEPIWGRLRGIIFGGDPPSNGPGFESRCVHLPVFDTGDAMTKKKEKKKKKKRKRTRKKEKRTQKQTKKIMMI